MKLLGVSGTIIGKKTNTLLHRVLEEVNRYDDQVEIEVLDMKEFDVPFCDGRDPDSYEGDTQKVLHMVKEADAYIIAAPIFQGSMPGVLKNLIDLIPPTAMKHKVIGFAATSGNSQHYLVIENQFKPVAGYLQMYTVPCCVFAKREDFNEENRIINDGLEQQIHDFARETVHAYKALHKANA